MDRPRPCASDLNADIEQAVDAELSSSILIIADPNNNETAALGTKCRTLKTVAT